MKKARFRIRHVYAGVTESGPVIKTMFEPRNFKAYMFWFKHRMFIRYEVDKRIEDFIALSDYEALRKDWQVVGDGLRAVTPK